MRSAAKTNSQPHALPGGLLIIFEGTDGSGKTTQLQLAQQALQAEGWPVETSRNLGGTPIGEELRKVMISPLERPQTTNLYLSVAIQEALVEAVEAQRARGTILLMDRGPISLAAYEIYGGQLDAALVWPHVDAGMARLKPELTIIYRTDVATGIERARQKSTTADYFESQPQDFFERVSQGYEATAERYPEQMATVDANQAVEAVHDQTMQLIRRALSASTPS